MKRPILLGFEDALEFRERYYSHGIRDAIMLGFFFFFFGDGTRRKWRLRESETNLLCSGITMVDSNIEVTTMHIHAHKRAN